LLVTIERADFLEPFRTNQNGYEFAAIKLPVRVRSTHQIASFLVQLYE
jgi:hypothetical protein